MSLVHRLAPAFALLAVGALSLDCDSDAIGVDACRTLESHRCSIAVGCPEFKIETESDVNTCQLFYRDQCLFGIDSKASEPDDIQVNQCLDALNLAAACKGDLTDCAKPPLLAASADAPTGCNLIHQPEQLAACDFLVAVEPDPGETGSGGAGGTVGAGGDATGGASAGGSGGTSM